MTDNERALELKTLCEAYSILSNNLSAKTQELMAKLADAIQVKIGGLSK